MAYCDYGAFVYLNGRRREDKEDVPTFDGPRVFGNIHHGIMGDDDIRVICHKQGLPQIVEKINGEVVNVEYHDEDTDYFWYGTISAEYKGYRFKFTDSDTSDSGHYEAEMETPTGNFWTCVYDYGYGAGLTD